MAGDGWIKAYRKIRQHPSWSHDGMLKLLFYCWMEANYKPSTYLVPGTSEIITVDRGSFVTGREVLLRELYPTKTADTPTSRTVARWLTNLEKMECLKLRTVSNRCTLVTVINYETYQSSEDGQCPTDVRPVSDSCPTSVRPVSTSEESNNLRTKESKNLPPSPPVDFETFTQPDSGPQIQVYGEDPLVWRSNFIQLWNRLPGVAQHTRGDLSVPLSRELTERLCESDWDWKAAFRKFPLHFSSGWRPTLKWFLKEDSVANILDGHYDATHRRPELKQTIPDAFSYDEHELT